ncbi:MAG: GNAT family N-acetyltransferase [Clostridia bacterium]|nr:GNAT family N-acetyltransferase [Clostridia bacterium]
MHPDIRLATERDIPALTELWQTCFPDSKEYIEFFYRENFDRMSVPVLTLDEKPIGMIHLMEASFAQGAEAYPVRFVYAVGMHPAYRGQGLMKNLLGSVTRSAEEKGCGLFLKPSQELIPFYESAGFVLDSSFRLFRTTPEAKSGGSLSLSPLSAADYNRLRNISFSGRPYVRWPDAHVQWAVDENAFCGGQTLSFSLDGRIHFLMGYPSDGVLHITETDLSCDQLRSIAFPLCTFFGAATSLEALFPEDACPEGEAVVSSLVFHAPVRSTYANLLLF